ncbi:uncharacterized protein LOC132275045 [Cornus florida]|uniref:uncharacterized protein LOC132275045 n=1 Tax=Cornus florida TaxID=4283 RepID=UPI00289B9A25|nr:uncharacterized protein LOC132275045 [Cornus florida]
MLSGLKFIPRDKLDTAQDENLDDSSRERKESNSRKEKYKTKKKTSSYSSSDDEDLERMKIKSRKKKKWYSSEEDESDDVHSGSEARHHRKSKKNGRKKKVTMGEDLHDDDGEFHSSNAKNIMRKEMGLEWMLRPKDDAERKSATTFDHQPEETPEETPTEEMKRVNPRELNPYLKDDGSGYPENGDGERNHLLSSSLVGDGGASWRLKALKRAQEQAAREGRKLGEVVEERWGSLGQLAVSVSSRSAAPTHAHLHAIKSRKRGQVEEQQTLTDNQHGKVTEKDTGLERRQVAFHRHPQMRAPKLQDSLSWGKRKSQIMSTKDAGIISSAISSMNKFSNDGSFMNEVMRQQYDGPGGGSYTKCEKKLDIELSLSESELPSKDCSVNKHELSANQLAAKALQLRLKGNNEEAEKLLKEVENMKVKETAVDESSRPRKEVNTSRYIMHDKSVRQKKNEEDADMHLAQKIVQNQRYSLNTQADDEYDYDDGPRRKTRKKGGGKEHKSTEMTNYAKRIMTQQERCQFCFENPTRPRHLVIAIANFTYLCLPHWQPVVHGHCCILPMQHESATRTVDNNVWDEIRNFKKCLIMMFAKQEKDLVFIETVMGLAQQRRHCLVECVPVPQEIAKQAPLYFKKAIDEAEDEWSQHNAKKLIDTSQKGLRGSIPKDFPYFHVEFGLNKGFVHVIDDETQFKSSFGLNVIRGMLQLPEEDMFRRRKHESVETQKQAVASFSRDWEPFDWTKQLG